MRDLLVYSLLRILLFVVIWWLLTLIGVGLFLAGVLAALIAMLLSIVLLNRPREAVAHRWQEADERRRAARAEKHADADANEEDALIEERASEQEADEQQH